MQNTLKPIGLARITPRTYPVFSFDGRCIEPRKTPIQTLADLLDYGYSVHVACGCKRSIAEVRAASFLALKVPAPESTPIRDLADFLVCKTCDRKDEISVRPIDGSYAGIMPRKAGAMRNGYFVPHEPYVPAWPLPEPLKTDRPRPKSHPRCKR